MVSPFLPVRPILAQATTSPPANPPQSSGKLGQIGLITSLVLFLALVGVLVYGKLKIYDQFQKDIKFEKYKSQDLQKRLKLALKTMNKMETNPDLIHSREFNLDYLRLRMDEEVFHYAIVNQIKIRVKQLISVALRPNTSQHQVGIATTGRQVDETFDVTYETEARGKRVKRILFRIQVKLTKLPTQSTSSTINQIIDCIEKFLSPNADHENWQPTIQGRVILMEWDQKAKPTPLLVLEQSGDGANVSFRTNPNRLNAMGGKEGAVPPPPPPRDRSPKQRPAPGSGKSQGGSKRSSSSRRSSTRR
ncbi:hypothetical protein [Spirulina sp. 06S082]|uniref:hypothetical protein n=1 Tax=Spirulina sp. 06S082 TaxID=3110248 RepID=UPI002B1F2B4C|nr:hypothetical protein [Spirulina sp. 06S082]MEA5469300.1 hypothetical protein [Spirulina sp. 06S082]